MNEFPTYTTPPRRRHDDPDATADETAAQVIIAKNRDGQTGAVNIHWNPGRAMYVNAARPINL